MENERPVDKLPPHFGATLDYIGSIIVTIGEAISTIGIGIDIAQHAAAEEKRRLQNNVVGMKLEDMQRQIIRLQKELELLKKERR